MHGGALDSSSPEGQENEKKVDHKVKPKKELTEEEMQKRNKMMVLGAAVIGMVLIVLWLLSSLGGSNGDSNGMSGFNIEMPDADQGSSRIADKDKAYEMDGVKKSLNERHDLGAYSVSETDSVSVSDDMNLMAKAAPKDDGMSPAKQKVQQSAEACNALSQTLGSFYQPSGDAANDELQKRISELEEKLSSQTTSGGSNVDDQLALMEKSYQLAAKYMPGQNGEGQVQYAGSPRATLPGTTSCCCPLSTVMLFPFELIVSLEQADMLLRASPLNPRVLRLNRSSRVLTLLVAWLLHAMARSSADMPDPLSITVRLLIPPSSI